jgi:hypothetical protein
MAIKRGTSAADVINGTLFTDWLFGRAGNDRIDGRGGDDALWGDAGNDILQVALEPTSYRAGPVMTGSTAEASTTSCTATTETTP